MATLEKLRAREVFDSRGRPTIEVEVTAGRCARGRAIAPAGGSVGKHEARELRDGDPTRHGGRGVRKAIALIAAEVAPALQGMDLEDQEAVDAALIALDGTPDRSRLGVNTILAASFASASAAAATKHEELHVHLNRLWKRKLRPGEASEPSLPMPMAHMISGQAHVGRTLDFQDVLMIPVGARDFSEALEMTFVVYRALGDVLHKHGHPAHLSCQHGAYGPKLWGNAQAVDHLLEAVLVAGLRIGGDVVVALDVAASHLHDPETATYSLAVGRESHDSAGMIAMLEHWTRQYPIASIEDGLHQDDWDGWSEMTGRLGATVQLVGDDLFASRADRIASGMARKAANAVSIKPGQVGTLSETFDALASARRLGCRAIIAARAGETEDSSMADLAVATAAGQVKIGGLARSERLAKYNRLLRIEQDLGPSATYAGRSAMMATVGAKVTVNAAASRDDDPGEVRPKIPGSPTKDEDRTSRWPGRGHETILRPLRHHHSWAGKMTSERRKILAPLFLVIVGLAGVCYFTLATKLPHPGILDRDEARGACVGFCLGLELVGGVYLYKSRRKRKLKAAP